MFCPDREIDVKIEKIDRDNKKISLDSLQTATKNPRKKKDDYHKFMPKATKTMGTFGDLLKKPAKKKSKK